MIESINCFIFVILHSSVSPIISTFVKQLFLANFSFSTGRKEWDVVNILFVLAPDSKYEWFTDLDWMIVWCELL
jgi:hypothetical protein